MKIHHIKTLVQIADSGSIRAAARDLNISQSALTRSMKDLEAEVGAELISRSYRGAEFTPAGQAMLVRARSILESIERAKDEIRQISGGAGAKVSIGVTPVVASTLMAQVYRNFSQTLPQANLCLHEGLLTDIVPGLIEGKLDFGVAIASASDLPTELSFTRLCGVQVRPVARADHPLINESDWHALLAEKWILNQTLGSSSNGLLNWLESQCLPIPDSIVQCTSPQVMLELMRRTDLIGFGPARLINDPISGAGLRTIETQIHPPLTELGIIRVRGLPLTPASDYIETLIQRAIVGGYGTELETGRGL